MGWSILCSFYSQYQPNFVPGVLATQRKGRFLHLATKVGRSANILQICKLAELPDFFFISVFSPMCQIADVDFNLQAQFFCEPQIWFKSVKKIYLNWPVFRIHNIFEWIRIRGSMPLANGSWSDPKPGYGSCFFRHWPSRCQQKTICFWTFFLLITVWKYIYMIFQRLKVKKGHKIVGIEVLLTIFAWWQKEFCSSLCRT